MKQHSTLGRILAVLFGTITGLLFLSVPAWAHVEIVPDSAQGGSTGTFAFHVPNERENASTIRVELVLPRSEPAMSVTALPVVGWTVTEHRAALDAGTPGGGAPGVSSIVWEGGSISPGMSEEFRVSMGPLPQNGQLVFKTLQTYSDGEVVRWIDKPVAAAGVEPEHPAAVLTVTPAGAVGLPMPEGPDPGFVLPGVVALTGLLGLTVLALHRRSRRRPARPAPAPDREQADLPGR